MEVLLKYLKTNPLDEERLSYLTLCWNDAFTKDHIIFVDYKETVKKERNDEVIHHVDEFERVKKILCSLYENMRKYKNINHDDADDILKRLFVFYCLYRSDIEIYNNLINGGGGDRMSYFEKNRKAVKFALSNPQAISFTCKNGNVTRCCVHRATSGNKVAMERLELEIFISSIRDSDIGDIVNLHEGESLYNPSHGGVWEKLISLAISAVEQTDPRYPVRSGKWRGSHTKQLAYHIRPLYRFLIDEQLSCPEVLGKFSTSEYILRFLGIDADSNLIERYITRNA